MLLAGVMLATCVGYVLAQQTSYCPGGSVSLPSSTPPPPVIATPLQKNANAKKRQPVFGLTSSISTATCRNPTAVLTSPTEPTCNAQAATAVETAAAAFIKIPTISAIPVRPAPPMQLCKYSCYSDSDCSSTIGEKCCVQGCVQACAAAVNLTSPPVTCAAVKCRKGSQCLNLESGAVCDTGPLHAGTCPDPSTFYGGSFAPCTSDSACNSNEKCCQSHSTGFLCTPVRRLFPLTCADLFCSGNKVCAINTHTGLPECVRNKAGQCPYYEVLFGPLRSVGGQCVKNCKIDRDCSGNLKCCQVGCDMTCVAPDLSNTCKCKQCSGPFVCREDEYGYGSCVSITKKPGMCSNMRIMIDIPPIPCIGNDKPGECGVDGDCRGNQKCCRNDYCHPSKCEAPATSCENIYCNFDERCDNSTGIALCVKGLCPSAPNVTAFCPVTSAISSVGTCRGDADCSQNALCSSSICCPGVCGQKTCRKTGIYCGYTNDGKIQVCPAGDLCLNPLYPIIQNLECYNPKGNTAQISGCF